PRSFPTRRSSDLSGATAVPSCSSDLLDLEGGRELRPGPRGAQSPRSSSLMLVFSRVAAVTRLTITAQYRLWLPSAAGSEPLTTTEPGGIRPYVTSPVMRL